MGIEQICKSITKFFNNARPPFPQINGILLACSMIRRPGLSTIQSTANIIKDLNRLGIPTGPMPDGSTNLTVASVFAAITEIQRSLKEDAFIQGANVPGTGDVVAGDRVGKLVNAMKVYCKID